MVASRIGTRSSRTRRHVGGNRNANSRRLALSTWAQSLPKQTSYRSCSLSHPATRSPGRQWMMKWYMKSICLTKCSHIYGSNGAMLAFVTQHPQCQFGVPELVCKLVHWVPSHNGWNYPDFIRLNQRHLYWLRDRPTLSNMDSWTHECSLSYLTEWHHRHILCVDFEWLWWVMP